MASYQLFKKDVPKYIYVKRKNSKDKSRLFLLIASFIIPILLLMPAFINLGIFPFGGYTTLAVDLRNQYMGFFQALKQAPSDPMSLFYSFNKGPGGIMTATDAYYLMSPLNFIFFLFPSSTLPIAVEIIQLIKIGLAGVSFAFYLIKSQKARDYKLLFFSTAYALMGFNIANLLNLMWLDPIILLPLIAYYLERLILGKSPLPYVLLLSLAIISNFYMAYMVCLFLILFFFWSLTRLRRSLDKNNKSYMRVFLRFSLYSLIAGGICAFLLLPTLHSLILSKGPYADRVSSSWSAAYPPLDVFARLIPFSFDYSQVSNGLPNIYVGVFASILLFLYLLSNRIALREKVASIFIIIFMLASMIIKNLNIFWHGMQYPIWYNYRFSWLLCFFILVLAFRYLQRAEKVSWTSWIGCIFIFSCFSAYIFYRRSVDKESFQYVRLIPLLVFPCLVFIYMEILGKINENKYNKKLTVYPMILLLICFMELSINSAFYLSVFNYESLDSYAFYDEKIRDLVEKIGPAKNDFYRIEKDFMHDKNDGMRFGYSGLSHFNSTYEHSTVEFLSDLGFAVARASSYNGNSTKFTDALFSTKYYLKGNYDPKDKQKGAINFKSKSRRPDLSDMKLIEKEDYMSIYENPHFMPLGLIAKEGLEEFKEERLNPLDLQEKIANLISPDYNEINYFKLHDIGQAKLNNLLGRKNSDGLNKYERINPAPEIASLQYKIPSYRSASHYLTLSESLNDSNSEIYLDGKKLENIRTSSVKSSQIVNISATKEENRDHDLEIRLKDKEKSFLVNNICLFSLDEDAFDKMTAFQQDKGLKLDYFSSSKIKGSFETDDLHPYLLLSIPYSEGWNCKIDNEKVNTFKALNALTGVKAGPGKHVIELYYRPPLFFEGLALSLSSLLFCYSLTRNIDKKRVK